MLYKPVRICIPFDMGVENRTHAWVWVVLDSEAKTVTVVDHRHSKDKPEEAASQMSQHGNPTYQRYIMKIIEIMRKVWKKSEVKWHQFTPVFTLRPELDSSELDKRSGQITLIQGFFMAMNHGRIPTKEEVKLEDVNSDYLD